MASLECELGHSAEDIVHTKWRDTSRVAPGARAGPPARRGSRPHCCHVLSARALAVFCVFLCFAVCGPLQCLYARSIAARWSLTARFFPDAGAREQSRTRARTGGGTCDKKKPQSTRVEFQ